MYRQGCEMDGKFALPDVPVGKVTMQEFLSQLSNDDFIALCESCYHRGYSMTRGIGDLLEFRIPAAALCAAANSSTTPRIPCWRAR